MTYYSKDRPLSERYTKEDWLDFFDSATNENMETFVWFAKFDFEKIMRHHPGHRAEQTLASLREMLRILHLAVANLNASIDEFDALSQHRQAFTRVRRSKIDAVEAIIHKEIFASSTAAHAVVEHYRRFISVAQIKDIEENRRLIFDEREHRFIIELRNGLHHRYYEKADWIIRTPTERERSLSFEFRADKLSSSEIDFSVKAQEYIKMSGSAINIKELFKSYMCRVDRFYEWLFEVYSVNLPVEVISYRAFFKIRNIIHARSAWRILLLQAFKPGIHNPYEHLDKYLTEAEIEKVSKLPNHSKEQVDLIISMIDEYGACDDELRSAAYRLFLVPMGI